MKKKVDIATGRDKLTLERVEEFRLTREQDRLIAALLRRGFDVYPANRSYYKQLPHFRLLIWTDGGKLVGHLAAECRIINVGGVPIKVFGIADLCVDVAFQHRRIATRIVAELESLGREHEVAFLVLLTNEPAVYESLAFERKKASCCWLLISNHQTLGVMRRSIDNIMIKPLGKRSWPEGPIDFLGHIF